jgi:hypothetical protein
MIERVYPGVFVTEVAFTAKPIDGVSTSMTGESVHPGVFVEELPFKATPIDGVSTSTDSAKPPAPNWTDANQGDPGGTLLQMFAWLPEALSYGAGVVAGLGLEASNTAQAPRVSVSPGLAVGADGRSVERESAGIVHRDPEP